MKIGIVGSGYVGLVSGACFAHLGHDVICVDNNTTKIKMLKNGEVPIYEPGLSEIIQENIKAKRISFTTQISKAVDVCEIIFICVNTPPKPNGEADLSFVENVAAEIADQLKSYLLIVEKSTVPVQTGKRIEETVKAVAKKKVRFDVASNPEFLREGSAISDFLKPDRVVVGVSSKRAEKLLRELYAPIQAPLVVTDLKSAEIIKHASNSFLATKISFINQVAQICEVVGADVENVAKGMGLDPRIGHSFLRAGVGFGGSCFPKDLAAFLHISEKIGVRFNLLEEVLRINQSQKEFFCHKIQTTLWNLKGKNIGVLGLAFKSDTDDMRSAPSIDIIHFLIQEGAKIRAYDPQAMEKAKVHLPKVKYVKDAYEACRGADALIILTEWTEFASLDFKKVKKLVKHPVIFDGRNLYQPDEMKKQGFQYHAVGRAR